MGGAIAWFRNLWNRVATVWYVRPMLAQQNAINERLVSELNSMRVSLSADLRALGEESLAGQTISVALDHEQQDAQRRVFETLYALTNEVQRLRRRISELERTLEDQREAQ